MASVLAVPEKEQKLRLQPMHEQEGQKPNRVAFRKTVLVAQPLEPQLDGCELLRLPAACALLLQAPEQEQALHAGSVLDAKPDHLHGFRQHRPDGPTY